MPRTFTPLDGRDTSSSARKPFARAVIVHACRLALGLMLAACAAMAQANAPWRMQAPLPTGDDLNGVSMVSSTEAWAVGDGGTIIHTNDGGVTWAKQDSGTVAQLNAVTFFDSQRGWAVGNTALYTTDGGRTWHEGLRTGNLSTLYQVAFADANNVFAPVGSGTGLLRSTDGGKNWALQDIGAAIVSVTFFDSLNGVASGAGVFYTRDGGKTWQQQSELKPAAFYKDFERAWQVNNSVKVNGWIQQTLDYSTDGGRTFTIGATPQGTYVSSLFFLDRLNGWGVGTQENIVRTSDGGLSWQTQHGGLDSPPVNKYLLNAVEFADDALHGIAVGNGGNIFTTSDGGATWTPRQSGSQAATLEIFATDSEHAWTANKGGEVLYTTDGGGHWMRAGATVGTDVTDVKFTDNLNGWATVEGGSTSAVLRSTDGGRTWQQTGAPMAVMYTVDTVDNRTVVAAGWSGNFGVILRSTDGGATWSQITYPPSANIFNQIHFVNASTGWLVGNRGTILKTTDGGATWSLQNSGISSGQIQDVSFVDENNGWAAGGPNLLHTTDGGRTWLPQRVDLEASIWSVHAVSPSVAWVCGYNGLVARTTDGGQTWQRESVGTDATFNSCIFLDSERGWVVGEASTVAGFEGRIYRRGDDSPAARHTISGRLTDQHGQPIADAFINLQGPYSDTLITDADGRYSVSLSAGGSYSVAPYKEGYVFELQHQTFDNLSADQVADFAGAQQGTTVFIGGRIVDGGGTPVAGIRVRLDSSEGVTPRYLTTDANGLYRFDEAPSGAAFMVGAEDDDERYTFAPGWHDYQPLVRNVSDANFVVTRLPRTIHGSLRDQEGRILYPATVQLSGTVTATTAVDATGTYFFGNLPAGGSYTVRPLSESFSFAPPEASFVNLTANGTADFVGKPMPPTNLARGKTATQSSTGWGGVASRAVDGNTDGNWANNSVTTTFSDAQAWWQVDLGAAGQLTSVKVWNRTDCCRERLYDFYVLVSDTPFASNDLQATIHQQGVWSYRKVGTIENSAAVTVGRTGRYVRIQLAGTNYLSLAEVEVMGQWTAPSPKVPVNLARGKATAQSSTGWGGDASRAVDGNTDGNWANNSMTATFLDNQAWWEVDLGSSRQLGSVKVWNRSDCCTERLSNFHVLVSDVPFTSNNLADSIAQAGVSDFHTAGVAGRPTTIDVNRAGRYVRVQLAGANYLSLSEVEVWGEQAAPTTQPVNLSLGKQSTQSSTGWGASSSRALDGNTSGNWSNNSVTTTLNDAQAWWEVDLGSARSIQDVKLWNRTDCCGERLSDFYVLVSETPFASQDLQATLSQPGVSGYRTTGAAGAQAAINVNRTGRYLRVQLSGTNYLSLAEVQVWGTP